jgi:hypothetical protein
MKTPKHVRTRDMPGKTPQERITQAYEYARAQLEPPIIVIEEDEAGFVAAGPINLQPFNGMRIVGERAWDEGWR